MELRQLRQFIVVAEELSFVGASKRLHIAQPALSVVIRKLEEDLGVELFVRSPRGLRITTSGEAALVAARRCIDAAAEMAISVRAATSEGGVLRIGCSASITMRLLPVMIRSFTHLYPRVQLELCEGSNAELLGKIESKHLDIAFVRVPTRRPDGIEFRNIENDVLCVAMPQQHPWAAQPDVNIEQFNGQDFVGYVPSPVGGLNAAVNALFARARVRPHLTQSAVQVQTVLGLVAGGLGVALVPAANTPLQSHWGLAVRPFAEILPEARIGIALSYRTESDNVFVRRFIEVAIEGNPLSALT